MQIHDFAAEDATASAASWRAHRPFGVFVIAYLLVRLATAWYVDAYLLLNADYNAVNIVQLVKAHDLPAADDMEAGHLRDVVAFSTMYFMGAVALDAVGIPPQVVTVLHHVVAPALLAVAVYAAAWVLFASAEVAFVAALVLFFGDYAWFTVNGGYPILFNQSQYYGDVNHVFAAALIAALLARRFTLAAAASVGLSLMNATYGINGLLCIAAPWLAVRASGRHEPGLLRAVVISTVGVIAGYGLPLLTLWLAPADAGVPAAVRDAAIRAYGHTAIHTSDPASYVAALRALLAVMAGAVLIERYRAPRDFGGRRPWFLLLAAVMLGLAVLQGVIAYWALFVAWPAGLMGAAPAKILMIAAIFVIPYIAYAVTRAARMLPPVGFAVVFAALAVLTTRPAWNRIWLAGAVVTLAAALPWGRVVPAGARIRLAAWALIALLAIDLGRTMARPFINGSIALAMELKDVSLRLRASVPADALLVPYRIGPASANRMGPFSNLALRTFSRRGYLPYWALGDNAYFNSQQRHLAEERSFSAAGILLWPDVLSTLDRERQDHPFEYFTGLAVRTAPCCGVSITRPAARRVLGLKETALERFVEESSPGEFARYAARLGGTHLFVSRDESRVPPWGPVLVESPHFLVIPIPPETLITGTSSNRR